MPKFETERNKKQQDETRRIVGYFISRDIYTFEEEYAPLDWYTLNQDKNVDSVWELKCRNIKSTDYEEVILTMDKYQELYETAQKYKCSAYYVIRFLDAIKIINLNEVVPSELLQKTIYRTFKKRRGHRTDKVESIMVPVSKMKTLCNWMKI